VQPQCDGIQKWQILIVNPPKHQSGVYNNKCCWNIIDFVLFKKMSSPGCKYPQKFGPPFSLSMLVFGFTIVSLVYQSMTLIAAWLFLENFITYSVFIAFT